MELDFNQKLNFDPSVAPPAPPFTPTYWHNQQAVYGAASTPNPLESYDRVTREMQDQGKSEYLNSILDLAKSQQDQSDFQALASMMNDQSMEPADKFKALEYYQANFKAPVDLKEKYKIDVAASNPDNLQFRPDAVIKGVFKSEEITRNALAEFNKNLLSIKPSVASQVGNFALLLAPFLGVGASGKMDTALMSAMTGEKDTGITSGIEPFLRGIFFKHSEKEIKDSFKNIPTAELQAKVLRAAQEAVMNMPGFDAMKYEKLAYFNGQDVSNGEAVLWDAVSALGAALTGVGALKTGVKEVKAAKGVKVLEPADIAAAPVMAPDNILIQTAEMDGLKGTMLSGQALYDATGELVKKLGTTRVEVAHSMYPQMDAAMSTALTPAWSSKMAEHNKAINAQMGAALEQTEHAFILTPDSLLTNIDNVVLNKIRDLQEMGIHLGKGIIVHDNNYIRGMVVLGPDEVSHFKAFEEAEKKAIYASENLGIDGVVSVMKVGDDGQLVRVAKVDKGVTTVSSAAERGSEELAITDKLPKNLSTSKPVLNKQVIKFADDFTKAAYLASSKSKNAEAYLEWAKSVSGLSEADVVAFGNKVREAATKGEDMALKPSRNVSDQFKSEAPPLSLRDETGKLLEPSGEFYVAFDYAKEVTPAEVLLFHKDAIKIDFNVFGRRFESINKMLTNLAEFAGPKVTQFVAAHHIMPYKATAAAHSAFDSSVMFQAAWAEQVQKDVAKALNPKQSKDLGYLLAKGEDEGRILTSDEVEGYLLSKGYPNKEVDKITTGYYSLRNVYDWMYVVKDRAESAAAQRAGYTFKTVGENKVLSKPASKDVVEDVRKVFDPASGKTIPISKKEIDDLYARGESLERLHKGVKGDDTLIEYTLVPKGSQETKAVSGVVPYIPGWVPRENTNRYFIIRMPKSVEINGVRFTKGVLTSTGASPDKVLANSRTVVAAADSEKDAKSLAKQMMDEDPSADYDFKRTRDAEKEGFEEYDLFRRDLVAGQSRSKEVLKGAKLEDPLIATNNYINSISRSGVFDEYMESMKASFVRNFGKFTDGQFPRSQADLESYAQHLTAAESKDYKRALQVYHQMKSQQMMRDTLQGAWKESLYRISELNIPVLSSVLRFAGDNLYPPAVIKKAGSLAFIIARPFKQLYLQPSQLITYAALDPKNSMNVPGKMYVLMQSWAAKNLDGDSRVVELVNAYGAKAYGMSVEEYTRFADHLFTSGPFKGVDQHTLMEAFGLERKIYETTLETVGRKVATPFSGSAKIAKRVGFSLGEQVHTLGAYVMAAERFRKMHPEETFTSQYAAAQILSDMREMTGSFNQVGKFNYQDGWLSPMFQFMSAPHKAFLSMTTSRMYTDAEKQRLTAAHLMLYGLTGWGLTEFILYDGMGPLGGLGLAQYLSDKPAWVKDALEGGVTDTSINATASAFYGERVGLDVAGTFSPISGGAFPMVQLMEALTEKDFSTVLGGAGGSVLVGKLYPLLVDFASLYNPKNWNEYTAQQIKDGVIHLSAGGSDWYRYYMAHNYGLLVDSKGRPVDWVQNSLEVNWSLIGGKTKREKIGYMVNMMSYKDRKKVEEEAKRIFDKFPSSALYMTDKEAWYRQRDIFMAGMSVMPEEARAAMFDALRRVPYNADKTKMRLMAETMLNSTYKVSREDYSKALNYLRSEPSAKQMVEILEAGEK